MSAPKVIAPNTVLLANSLRREIGCLMCPNEPMFMNSVKINGMIFCVHFVQELTEIYILQKKTIFVLLTFTLATVKYCTMGLMVAVAPYNTGNNTPPPDPT